MDSPRTPRASFFRSLTIFLKKQVVDFLKPEQNFLEREMPGYVVPVK
jgi:hypothetical protein